jgi:LysM repeat protein
VLLVLVLVLAGAVVLWHAGESQAGQQAEPAPALTQVTVQSGDTLWSVAHRIAPQRDARDVVDQLRRLNGLSTGQLRVGQQLLLPVVV